MLCIASAITAVACVGSRGPLAAGDNAAHATLPQWKGASPNGSNAFRFVVMGDNTGGARPGAWEEAIAEINLLKPDFVLSVGDLIEGYTTNRAELSVMLTGLDAMTTRLHAPFYHCPGNHDITNPMMYDTWVARYGVKGKSYYSFDYRNSHFVVLDTATPFFNTNMVAEEVQWLGRDLAASRQADHVFVFYHVPQWANADVWPQVAKLLDPAKTTIFNGHLHRLSYGAPDGIPTYVLAATGAEYPGSDDRVHRATGSETGEFPMFAHVVVDGGKPSVAIIPLHGVLPGDYLRQDMQGQSRDSRKQAPVQQRPDR